MPTLQRRRTVLLTILLACLVMPTFGVRAKDTSRPNILLIVSDDQRYDTMDYMPRTKAGIFDQGITFTNAYVTTPLCCPSRASILTGKYAHNHNVRDNGAPLNEPTFMNRLHDSGYYTGIVGKYLGYWQGTPREEFDYWASFKGTVAPYFDPDLNVNGKQGIVPGYITHLFRGYALDFLDRATRQDKPFALIVTPNAPHEPADPAPEDANLYPDLAPFRPPSFNEADVSGKSTFIQSQAVLSSVMTADIDAVRRKQLQSLNAVDDMVDRVLAKLKAQGELDRTLVIYMSDNGFLWGEHRYFGKKLAYEESVKVPFGVRYPPLVKSARVDTDIIGNIDIAPTIYELAGIPLPTDLDGRSFVPLLRGLPRASSGDWATINAIAQAKQRSLLMEGWNSRPWTALRYDRYAYVQYKWDRPELYDLRQDPYQLSNLADQPAYAPVLADMRVRMAAVAEPTPPGDDTSAAITYDGWTVVDPDGSGNTYRVSALAQQRVVFDTLNPTSSIAFVTARGPSMGKAQIVIDDVDFGTVDLYAPQLQRDVVFSYDNLTTHTHKITVKVLGQKNPLARGTTVAVEGFRVGTVLLDDINPGIMYSSWLGETKAAMSVSGGSFRSSGARGAKLSFTFTGTKATWITARGPEYGRADILVDGVRLRTVDLYNAKQQWQVREAIAGLAPGKHIITIMPTGTYNPASVSPRIVFDGYSVP